MEKSRYLGDAVYIRYDGFNFHLAVNHHENEVIVLEPSVAKSLTKFINECKK